jgi:quercetin dioxygenase-like cupin family protein
VDLKVRRVVTGHDARGKAVVTSDETLEPDVQRPGQQGCIIWTTDRVPADNAAPVQGPDNTAATIIANGAAFRIVRYEPGSAGRMHRTQSLDYGVVLSGSIVLQLDDDAEVTLHADDVLVQRGTIHNWINREKEACTIAFVVIDALPILET